MTDLTPITFTETAIDRIAAHEGRIAVFVNPEGRMDAGARRVNKLTRGRSPGWWKARSSPS